MATVQLVIEIEEGVIEKAKKYAEDQHTDLKNIVENYLQQVGEQANSAIENLPPRPEKKIEDFPQWIQELVLSKEPTPDFNHKAEYHKHLEEKYGL